LGFLGFFILLEKIYGISGATAQNRALTRILKPVMIKRAQL